MTVVGTMHHAEGLHGQICRSGSWIGDAFAGLQPRAGHLRSNKNCFTCQGPSLAMVLMKEEEHGTKGRAIKSRAQIK